MAVVERSTRGACTGTPIAQIEAYAFVGEHVPHDAAEGAGG